MRRTVLVIALLGLAGCATPVYVRNWEHVQLGMTRDEVCDLLGEPHSGSAPANVSIPTNAVTVRVNGSNVPPQLVAQGAKFFIGSLLDMNHERCVYGKSSFIGPPA
jgi:hypothetical protein